MDLMSEHTILQDGRQEWRLQNGLLHRLDGPAVIYASGTQAWWLQGKRHRSDGPAMIWQDGTQEWWLHGRRHRSDGPAMIWRSGTQDWFLNGRLMTDQIKTWMETKGVTWPWDAETQMEFVITWL
jgi:hypothetical protein